MQPEQDTERQGISSSENRTQVALQRLRTGEGQAQKHWIFATGQSGCFMQGVGELVMAELGTRCSGWLSCAWTRDSSHTSVS